MDLKEINQYLSEGKIDVPGVLPHLEALEEISYIFNADFGLNELPEEPGLLLIRGPRQYGKSTWLESQIKKTIVDYGPGSVLYLNGDDIRDNEALFDIIETFLPLFRNEAPVKRLFIDEITAVKFWETALKRLIDKGLLRKILVVSTGSKATDLRRGQERLPGRRGKLDRTNYLFTPVSFKEFERLCRPVFKENTLTAYLLSGGCPIACNEIAVHGKIPEYVIMMIRDWIYGECMATGRNRASLLAVLEMLIKFGGSPVGQSKLARESALANNTVAAGYIELLADLLTVVSCQAWDASKRVQIHRKPSKFHFINLLAAVSWHSSNIRSVTEFNQLEGGERAKFYEWLVAQELWRRAAVRGEEVPERLGFWQSQEHEIDFVIDPAHFIEVKLGSSSSFEFDWFPKIFPKSFLTVITTRPFENAWVRGVTMENFLMEKN